MCVQAAWAAPATHLLTMPSPQVHRNLQADLTYLAHYKHAQDSRRQPAGFMDPRQRLSVTVHVQRVTRVASHACAVCKVAQVAPQHVLTQLCAGVCAHALCCCATVCQVHPATSLRAAGASAGAEVVSGGMWGVSPAQGTTVDVLFTAHTAAMLKLAIDQRIRIYMPFAVVSLPFAARPVMSCTELAEVA